MTHRITLEARNAAGVVMLEVLLAVVILAVGLTVIAQSMMTALRTEAGAADYVQASALISRVWTGQRLTGGSVPREGEAEAPWERFHYTVTDAASSSDEADLSLHPLTVTAVWPAGQGERRLSVTAYGPEGASL